MTTELVPDPDRRPTVEHHLEPSAPATADQEGRRRRRRRVTWLLVGGAAFVALAVFVIVYFQPQKLFLDERVNEALPDLVVDTPPAADGATGTGTAPGAVAPEATAPQAGVPPVVPVDPLTAATAEAARLGAPVAVSSGSFVSLDHPTSGNAYLVVQPDGSRLLRIEELRTDNGPDVRVVLNPAAAGSGDYGGLIELGRLKGNIGSQNYEIPADVDLASIRSVVIWCERFSAPFGEAPAVLGT